MVVDTEYVPNTEADALLAAFAKAQLSRAPRRGDWLRRTLVSLQYRRMFVSPARQLLLGVRCGRPWVLLLAAADAQESDVLESHSFHIIDAITQRSPAPLPTSCSHLVDINLTPRLLPIPSSPA